MSPSNTRVTRENRDDGSTAIIIESDGGREVIELKVDDEDGRQVIVLDGEELEDGQTKVIVDELAPGAFHFGKFFPEDGDSNVFHIEAPHFEWNGDEFRALMEGQREQQKQLREDMGRARKELREFQFEDKSRQMEELRREMGNARERQREAMREYRDQMRHNGVIVNPDVQGLYVMPELSGVYFNSRHGSGGSLSGAVERALLADGLIKNASNYKFELSGKGWLKIDGKKMPDAVFQKYKRLYEDVSGSILREKSSMQIHKKADPQ